MRIERHPLGIWCREDGAVYLPQSGTHKARWTFGTDNGKGYRVVGYKGKLYQVHRLMAGAFLGPCPPGKPEIDHLDRDPANNAVDNLRYVDRSQNMLNTGIHEASVTKYGAASIEDRKAYNRAYSRAYYASSLKARERVKRSNKRYYEDHRDEICAHAKAYGAAKYAKMKALGLVKRRGPDGKQRWYPRIKTESKEIV